MAACRRGSEAGTWQITWRIQNLSADALVVESAWVPHGRFRGAGRLSLTPPRIVLPGDGLELKLAVHAEEAPGTLVENAFLILRVSLAGAAWRVFIRMRVEFDAQAAPHPIPELMTVQSAGAAE